MGFLSAWDATERIDVSDLAGDLPGTWWVDVKKCLSHGEADEVMRQLMESTMTLGDPTSKGSLPVKTSLSVDAVVDNQAMLVTRSIEKWNLTDKDGNLLPFEVDEELENPYEPLEKSLKVLPSSVYDRVAGVVVAANTEKSEETGSFPDERRGGDSDGLDYSPNDLEVLV